MAGQVTDESASTQMQGEESVVQEDALTPRQTLVTYFTPSASEGCAPLQVNFVNTSVNAVSVSWSFGDGHSSSEFNPGYMFAEPGRYTVTLRATGEDGISDLFSQVIEVFQVPEAGFDIEEGLEGADGVESLELMNYSTGAFSYEWDLAGRDGDAWKSNEFQPTLKTDKIPDQAGQLRLVATNAYGCTDTSTMDLPPTAGSAAREIKFPTAFNANSTGPTGGSYNPNDMRVDVFHPHFSEEPAEYHLQIFSRMGELVFESHDIYVGWDGYVREEQAAGGVYLWVAEGTWDNGSGFSKKGDVTLLWGDWRR